jgi:hypothetical protein
LLASQTKIGIKSRRQTKKRSKIKEETVKCKKKDKTRTERTETGKQADRITFRTRPLTDLFKTA